MADEADIANDYIDHITNTISSLLNNRHQNAKGRLGSKTCRECAELIPVERRQLGFQLCIECAAETERRKSLFANY
jgi:RNA polymerase-binding transcription factor DksA